MELFNGTMVRFSKENGKMAQKMVLEPGNLLKVIFMKANGK
jgi:hypothetical protein